MVGIFCPSVESWNLDIIRELEPSYGALGGKNTTMEDGELMSSARVWKRQPQGCGSGTFMEQGESIGCSCQWLGRLWDIAEASTDSCDPGPFPHHKDKIIKH
jgi:hypothetical protein